MRTAIFNCGFIGSILSWVDISPDAVKYRPAFFPHGESDCIDNVPIEIGIGHGMALHDDLTRYEVKSLVDRQKRG